MSDTTTEPAPEPTPEPEREPEPEDTKRCDAETTMSGTLYRCALNEGHDDEHRFQVVEDAPPEPRSDDRDMGKRLKALDNEAERHAKRIREIIGEDADGLVQCELCAPNFGGWRFDTAPNEDVTRRVRVAIGMPDLANYRPSATERKCDDCGGLGRVLTGSSVAGRETAPCDPCSGAGFVPTRPRQHPDAAPPPPPEAVNGGAHYPDDGVKRDMFGTPEGDPDYEKLPGARQRPIEYWQQQRT